jgi:hypothetical protein
MGTACPDRHIETIQAAGVVVVPLGIEPVAGGRPFPRAVHCVGKFHRKMSFVNDLRRAVNGPMSAMEC